VVLAAGAVGTPQLLQLSGIGDRVRCCTSTASPVQHDAARRRREPAGPPADPRRLRVQGVKTLNTLANSLWARRASALEYLLRRSGPMSMAPSQLGRVHPLVARPRMAERRIPRAAAVAGRVRRAAAPLQRVHRQRVQPQPDVARGGAASARRVPADAPRIQARYLSTPKTAGGRRFAAPDAPHRAMPALARYRPREIKPGVQFHSDDDLARLAGDIGTTIFHPVGTCRMGRGRPGAVVDARLRGAAASAACALPTPASCPPSPAATPTPRC
jgi:choline dehydrogenase